MVNYFIYARDCSFSTFNNEHYHSNGLKTLEQFKRDVENIREEQAAAGEPPTESRIIYLHWGDDCWEVDEHGTRTAYLNRHCEKMGSEPEWIIRHLQKRYMANENDKIKLLYIITDGLISNQSAKKCFRLNELMHYETFVFHAFTEDSDNIDLSVAASFFKSRCLVYHNYKLFASTDISKDFSYNKIDAYNFAAEKEHLKFYIMLKFINEFRQDAVALEEIVKLKKLRDRLFGELSSETVNVTMIEVNPKTKGRNEFLHKFVETDWNNNLVHAMELVLKADIDKFISSLINYIVSEEKSYSFNVLTFDECVEEEQIDGLAFTAEQEYEIFDFVLEDDVGIPCDNRRLVDAT